MLSKQPATNNNIDTLLVPIGGGGLISGIAFAVKNLNKKVKKVGYSLIMPLAWLKHLALEDLYQVDMRPTIADGLAGKEASESTLGMIQRYVDEIVLVSEEQTEEGVLTLLRNDHVLAEPSGAAGVAAIMYSYRSKRGETVAAVVSGGNIEVSYLTRLLNRK